MAKPKKATKVDFNEALKADWLGETAKSGLNDFFRLAHKVDTSVKRYALQPWQIWAYADAQSRVLRGLSYLDAKTSLAFTHVVTATNKQILEYLSKSKRFTPAMREETEAQLFGSALRASGFGRVDDTSVFRPAPTV